MNEQKLKEISKRLGIPVVDIEEARELSQSITDETSERFQYLKVLKDPKVDLKLISRTYDELLLFEEEKYGPKEGSDSITAARFLVSWTRRAVLEFKKARLSKDVNQMMHVYNYSPNDEDLGFVMIDEMVRVLEEEITTKA